MVCRGRLLYWKCAPIDWSVLRVGSEMHHLLAIRAMQHGASLNTYCANLLKQMAVGEDS